MSHDCHSYRIVLANVRRLLADMVERAVDGVCNAAIVGRVDSLDELAAIAAATEANVVLAGLDAPGLAPACRDLLFDHPRTQVLCVVEPGGRSYLYLLRPNEIDLGELSPDEMVRALSDARYSGNEFT